MISAVKHILVVGFLLVVDIVKGEFFNAEPNLVANGRNLQDTPRGFFESVIANITLNDLSENIIDVELIYFLTLQEGVLQSVDFPIYHRAFGSIVEDSVRAFYEDEEFPATSLKLNSDERGIVRDTLVFGDLSLTAGLHRLRALFQVEGAVCSVDGISHLTASWMAAMNVPADARLVEVDYVLPAGTGLGGMPFVPENVEGEFSFENDSKETLILTYKGSVLGTDLSSAQDMRLNLSTSLFANQEECSSVQSENNILVFVIAVPAAGCGLLLCLAAIQKIYDSRNPPSTSNRRTNALNRLFPGTPDIVLAPDARDGNTTVRAVLEDDDNPDFDGVMPITTIQVRVGSEAEPETRV